LGILSIPAEVRSVSGTVKMFKAETTAIVLRRAKKVDWNRMLVGEEVRMRMETKEVRVGFDRCVEGETESHCETFI
jgi:hypothetical protein